MDITPIPKSLIYHTPNFSALLCDVIVVVERQLGLRFIRTLVKNINAGIFAKNGTKAFPVSSIVNVYHNTHSKDAISAVSMGTLTDTSLINKVISSDNLLYSCHGLENGNCLIPEGIYELTVSYSPKFNTELPGICDVPKRDGIRIHAGNKATDSAGCLLLGKDCNYSTLLNSRVALNQFIDSLKVVSLDGSPVRMCIIVTNNVLS